MKRDLGLYYKSPSETSLFVMSFFMSCRVRGVVNIFLLHPGLCHSNTGVQEGLHACTRIFGARGLLHLESSMCHFSFPQAQTQG